MNIQKMAAQDARRMLAAELFFGEGAGTRRKLLNAEIQDKFVRLADTDYADWFNLSYETLDRGKFAEKAIAERKRIDRAVKTGKNLRAIKNGNVRGLSTGVFTVVAVGYVVHASGLDKPIIDEGKKLYRKARIEVRYRKARWQGRNVEKIF